MAQIFKDTKVSVDIRVHKAWKIIAAKKEVTMSTFVQQALIEKIARERGIDVEKIELALTN